MLRQGLEGSTFLGVSGQAAKCRGWKETSDALFVLTITLLAVSLEVLRTFPGPVAAMQDFFASAVCFSAQRSIW
jgi:hypothetical protein